MADHLHHGHRKRKKEQFLKSGIEHLPEHEALEFLLYYVIPRGDTNSTAHKLIKRFGSLVGVLNARYDDLLTVEGIGENSAGFIRFVQMFSKLYLQRQAQGLLEEQFDVQRLKEYCAALFSDSVEEEFCCLYFTDDMKLIDYE
jgi:DNA repair protein RadC